ncbi:hypothetical protein M3J09_003205 [Ascochyta lentis]
MRRFLVLITCLTLSFVTFSHSQSCHDTCKFGDDHKPCNNCCGDECFSGYCAETKELVPHVYCKQA